MLNKQITFIVMLIFVLSCTSKKPNSVAGNFRKMASVQFNLSEVEHDLNDCYTNAKVSCYELYPYSELEKRWGDSDEDFSDRAGKVKKHFDSCVTDHSISCSKLAGRDDLVENLYSSKQNINSGYSILAKHDWFFLSLSKIKSFLSAVKKVGELKDKIAYRAKKFARSSKDLSLRALHGTGVGITGSVFAGIGTSFTGEALILDKNLSLYCAPGSVLTTDIGAQVNFAGVKALSCKNKNSYKGKFMSVLAGVSAEAIGLPLGIEAAYSFGMHENILLDGLLELKREKKINIKSIMPEMIVLSAALPLEMAKSRLSKTKKAAMWLSLKLTGQLMAKRGESKPDIDSHMKKSGFKSRDLLKTQGVSLGHAIKSMVQGSFLNNILIKYKLRNLKLFFKKLGESLSGCDSISAGISASLTVSPVNVGVMFTHYEEIFNVNLDKLLSLRNVSAFLLLNPLLMDREMLSTVIRLAQLMDNMPSVVEDKCYGNAMTRAKNNFHLVNELLK